VLLVDLSEACKSLDCGKLGLLCDEDKQKCVPCDAQFKCAKGFYCAPEGTCVQQLCAPGSKGCMGKTVSFLCNEQGSGTEWQKSCDDQSVCTAGDRCEEGECVYDSELECSTNGDHCKEALCDPQDGCIIRSIVATCNDQNFCTNDSCEPAVGCINAPQTGPDCDDTDPCTKHDYCKQGVCSGTAIENCGCASLELGQGTAGVWLDDCGQLFNEFFFIDVWVKTAAEGFAGGRVAGFVDSEGKLLWELVLDDAGKAWFTVDPKGLAPILLEGKTVAVENWHHVAVQRTQKLLRLFVDGKKTDFALEDAWPRDEAGALFLGCARQFDDGVPCFRGFLDDFRVGASALLTEPFSPVENPGPEDARLWWSMNQKLAPTVFDTASYRYHGELVDAATWSAESPGTICAPLVNFPPSTPLVSISPEAPGWGEDLACNIQRDSIDEEGTSVVYSYSWLRNGTPDPSLKTALVSKVDILGCPPFDCQHCETWTCLLTGKDLDLEGRAGRSQTVTVGADTCVPCDGSVFGASCYHWYAGVVDYAVAKAACETTFGGHLVTITSAPENAFVLGLAAGKGDIWLGLSDQASEGQYQWVNGEPFSFSNWSAGQPDNSFNEDCAQMYVKNGSGKWNDLGCTRPDPNGAPAWWPKGYICEKEWNPLAGMTGD
jgi:hypothetical protein